MNCLKCGRDVPEGQSFCDSCIASMADYPVRPGTVVVLPPKKPTAPVKKGAPRKKTIPPEETISILKRHLAACRIIIFLVALALAGSTVCLVLHRNDGRKALGQNYSTVSNPTDETEVTSLPAE